LRCTHLRRPVHEVSPMPPQSRNKGESKQGLVITLVFFILATLGLGVSTYYGFEGQEAKDKAAKEAKKDADLFKGERDWYKFQAGMYSSYMGQPLADAEQLGTQKTQFDQGTMKVTSKDKEEVTKVLQALDKRLGWNVNKPKATYESQLSDLNAKYDALAKSNGELEKRKKAEETKVQKKDEELKDAQLAYDDNLKKLKDKAEEDQKKALQELQTLHEKVDKQETELEKANLTTEQAKKTLGTQIEGQKKELTKAKERIADQQSKIEATEVKTTEAPPDMRGDWKIVGMDQRGTHPYIN